MKKIRIKLVITEQKIEIEKNLHIVEFNKQYRYR